MPVPCRRTGGAGVVISDLDMLLRMGAAAGLGAAIGYERERAGRPAGLRTHLLVALASATFMLVSSQFVYFQSYGKDDLVVVDSSRIAASVVSGVGFLGAGAILRTGIGVHGLTTAASLWLAAAVGLAAGSGMFLVAGVATVVALLSLVYLRRIEGKQWRLFQRRVAVLLKDAGSARQAVVERLRGTGVEVADVEYDLNVRGNRARLLLDVRLKDAAGLDRLLTLLSEMPEVRRVKVRKPGG
jgi:putative Mg2+ transporter-C (MgtC) family protein